MKSFWDAVRKIPKVEKLSTLPEINVFPKMTSYPNPAWNAFCVTRDKNGFIIHSRNGITVIGSASNITRDANTSVHKKKTAAGSTDNMIAITDEWGCREDHGQGVWGIFFALHQWWVQLSKWRKRIAISEPWPRDSGFGSSAGCNDCSIILKEIGQMKNTLSRRLSRMFEECEKHQFRIYHCWAKSFVKHDWSKYKDCQHEKSTAGQFGLLLLWRW